MGRGIVSRLFPLLLLPAVLLPSLRAMAGEDRMPPVVCSYEESRWNVPLRQSVGHRTVSHSYSRLAPEEIDPETGCTVCSEDQVLIAIPPLEPFRLCWKLAPKVRQVLERLLRDDAPIFSTKGYVVIRSRGPLDADGSRTVFSSHSFGTALDINAQQNGLYDNCIEFGPWSLNFCALSTSAFYNRDSPFCRDDRRRGGPGYVRTEPEGLLGILQDGK